MRFSDILSSVFSCCASQRYMNIPALPDRHDAGTISTAPLLSDHRFGLEDRGLAVRYAAIEQGPDQYAIRVDVLQNYEKHGQIVWMPGALLQGQYSCNEVLDILTVLEEASQVANPAPDNHVARAIEQRGEAYKPTALRHETAENLLRRLTTDLLVDIQFEKIHGGMHLRAA